MKKQIVNKQKEKQIPYRNAIKLQSIEYSAHVLLVDTLFWIEVHCISPFIQKACEHVKSLVHRAIGVVSSKFYSSSNVTKEGTLCSECQAGICYPGESMASITCTEGCFSIKMNERQSCWLIGK